MISFNTILKKWMSNYGLSLTSVFYEYNWFNCIINKTTTDNKLQFIIPIKEDLIQISYSDDYNADFWNALSERETVNQITRFLKEMFPNEASWRLQKV